MLGRKVIKIEKLFKKFSKHVKHEVSCKSAWFVCNFPSSFESWFRVELCPVLFWKLRFKDIDFNYAYPDYPDSRYKADICVSKRPDGGDIVFELKSFVYGQDANKMEKYPEQIKRLEKLIGYPSVLQVITFTTFIGYPNKAFMESYMDIFFADAPWKILGPCKLIKKYPLYVAITSMTK